MRVDIGGGHFPLEGYTNLDILPSADIVHDLESGTLPFEDNSADYFNCSHVLEHIRNLIPLMNEMYRCLKETGIVFVEVPLFPDTGAIKDPTHVRYFIPESFDYFDRNWDYPKQPDYGIEKWSIRQEIAGEKPHRVIKAEMMKV